MMKIFNTFFFLFAGFLFVNAQSTPNNYSRVKIDLSDQGIEEVAKLGLETDHGVYRPGEYLINDFSSIELDRLEHSRISYEVLISDVQRHYTEQNNDAFSREIDEDCNANRFPYVTPENYAYGSMGGYLTYDELLNTLDSMYSKFPHLISRKEPIGDITTYEGRPIYWLKVGDRPSEDEDEPKILYTALHHAREANSLSQMIFYIWYLLENYDNNEEVRFIVDSTSLYFIPCVNPDGYVYNEEMNPSGGGLWRKNRHLFDDNGIGVDLNRNYGFQWGYDDIGSSANPISETYRGTEGFSEPETQAVRDFCLRHDFKIVLNYHTYGNLMIYPWGFTDESSSDDLTFKGLSEAMTLENGFVSGTAIETVGYPVNGGSDDWMYEESGTYALTPEVGSGSFGFWPPKDAIDYLNKSVLAQNITAAKLLHTFLEVKNVENENELLHFSVKKYSVDSKLATLKLKSLNSGLVLSKDTELINLEHLEEMQVEFPYILTDDIEGVVEVEVVTEYDSYLTRDTINVNVEVGGTSQVFSDVGDNLENWESDEWGISTEVFYSDSSSITDSPAGPYSASSFAVINLTNAIDLSNAIEAKLEYQARWEIEEDFDYAQIFISIDSVDYSPVCAKYTEDGTIFQKEGQPVYDGTQLEWVLEEIDLTPYVGEKIWLRFLLSSDEVEHQDGLYLDDMRVTVREENFNSSVNVLLANDEFRVSPNPFTEEFQVIVKGQQDYDIAIFNELGSKVQKENLPPGLYFVMVSVDGELRSILKAIKI